MHQEYNLLWLFLTVPWVGLQYAIVVFPDHTRLLLKVTQQKYSVIEKESLALVFGT